MSLEGSSYESTRTDLSLESSNVIIEGQWIVLGRIGEGSFGEVFEIRDLDTDRHYAIKRERLKVRQPQLGHENLIYDALAGGVGIPQCHWHGQYDGFDCLVMDLLGPSINQLRGSVADMSLDIVVDLGCQMSFLPEAEMVESMDASGMTTVDYKKPTCRQVFDTLWPDKSCMKLWLVDFGLATFWRDPDTGKLVQNNKHIRHKIGTARYASINVHRGRAHSRRDDLESITYIVLDLLLGTLPWTGIQAKNSKAGWERMKQLKVDTYMSDLCAGLPEGILQFVEYPRSLQFNDEPDYTKMRAFLQGSLPGGPYAQPVRSPFGGKTVSADSYAPKDDQNAAMHIRHPPATLHATSGMDQHHMQPFSMDEELAHQLKHAANIVGNDAMTHTPASPMQPNSQYTQNTEKQQKKHESSSSYKELLRRNKPKKVGWNTYKHDDEPWNPQADWMRGDSDATSRSWGDTPAAGHATTDASSSWG
ncbi:kinase-like domain-containing protein, partial [Gongronella butleri]